MVQIENRLETTKTIEKDYLAGYQENEKKAARKRHRSYVGGMWEQMGAFQSDFLKQHGLRPQHTFLDVGCGSLRAGRVLVDYLSPGNYYGIDIDPGIIGAGYDHELTEEQRARLPVENLHATDRFDCSFGQVRFDTAIAQSVFSHISLNLMRLCMYRVAQVMKPGGSFFVTFFEREPEAPIDHFGTSTGSQVTTYTERDPYWYYSSDLEWMITGMPWEYHYIGDWGHPRGQRMARFVRTTG